MIMVPLFPSQLRVIRRLAEAQAKTCPICAEEMDTLLQIIQQAEEQAEKAGKARVAQHEIIVEPTSTPKLTSEPKPTSVPRSKPNPGWKPDEDAILLTFGRNIKPIPWDVIATRLPHRTPDACKARLGRLMEKEMMTGVVNTSTPPEPDPVPAPVPPPPPAPAEEPVPAPAPPPPAPEPQPQPVAASPDAPAPTTDAVSPMSQPATAVPWDDGWRVRPPTLAELMKGR